MQITLLGGADEVGASSTLIEIGGRRVLVDAGIRPSPKARYGLTGDQLPDLSQIDRAGGVDAILVTHAHLDHSGCLELVVGRYDCPVYATPATIALSRVLHRDSQRIMASRMEEEGELPLFDEMAAQKLIDAFVPAPFHARLLVADGLAATFYPGGHIAGAAMIFLESAEGSVLVSGDVSVSPQRTVEGLTPPRVTPDLIVLESTYGGRLHANRAAEERRLVDTVKEVLTAGGKVLIPAFALGRAQEVLLTLKAFRRRGELPEVTIWADGMVRAICGVYQQFPEALAPAFREEGADFFGPFVRPVEHAGQRSELVWQEQPLVIVSSSGMLAGGPSVFYAKEMAGKPQHAILLTGYQDEEAPGRHLQRLAQRGGGTLRLGEHKVSVACRLDTYALSAHADEGQLISLVEALDVPRVILVHGEEEARQSLAAHLEERGRIVMLPRSGQTIEVRPAPAVSFRRLRGIGAGRPLDLRALWLAIGDPGGGEFTAEELAQVWWGEEERTKEIVLALEKEPLYFVPHRTRSGLYRARTRPQVEHALQQREQMAALPDLRGALLIVRDAQGRARPACGAGMEATSFLIEGETTPYGPEQLVEIVGPCTPALTPDAVEAMTAALSAEELLPANTPRPLDEIVAQVDLSGPASLQRAAVALCLLRAGAERGPEGYLIEKERMEPNQALAYAQSLFPPEARLQRCGYYSDQGVMQLVFDFPDVAAERYTALFDQIETDTGWEVQVKPEANQVALGLLAGECLPEGWQVVKGPSIHRERREVAITVQGDGGDLQGARRRFTQATGYELIVSEARGGTPLPVSVVEEEGGRWEINSAYAEIKRALAGSTLYKTSLKGERIVLSFISPQVGERYQAEIEALSRRIGWPLEINPHPNQVAIAGEARSLVAAAGAVIVKGPGIYTSRGEVVVRLETPLPEETTARLKEDLMERTGYRLTLEEG